MGVGVLQVLHCLQYPEASAIVAIGTMQLSPFIFKTMAKVQGGIRAKSFVPEVPRILLWPGLTVAPSKELSFMLVPISSFEYFS